VVKDFALQPPEYPCSLPGPPLFRGPQGPRSPCAPRPKDPWLMPVLPRRQEGRSRANRLYVP
jgi:hypothetical protein